jgi:hypothetical protein
VGAYQGGSELFSLSRDRVQGFTDELRQTFGIPIYDSIQDLTRDVDAIFLLSVDGRQHPQQFAQMAIGKPVFIDKPFATSTADAREIIRLAKVTLTPIMSCSSERYSPEISGIVGGDEAVVSCEAFGPAPILDDYPGLFWYGVHGAEILFSLMGAGCKAVQCVPFKDVDVVIGQWDDGRVGLVRGTRFKERTFGCVVHTEADVRCAVARSPSPRVYSLLLENVIQFFRTGVSPIDMQETLEITAFLEAANTSKEQGGVLLPLSTGA